MPPPRIPLLQRLQRLHILRSSFRPPHFARPLQQAWFPTKVAFRYAQVVLGLHLISTYWFSIQATSGISMVPTIPHNEGRTKFASPLILISKTHQRGHNVGVGDVVVYTHPMSTTSYGCKRIIGMPGDLVCAVSPGKQEKDLHTVDGDFGTFKDEMFRVPEGHCWLAGDNLEWSRDSRLIGPVPLALVKGKVMAVLFPFSAWKWLGNGGLEDLKEGEPEWVAG